MSGLDIDTLVRGHLRSSARQVCEVVQLSARTLSERERKAFTLSALKLAASHLEKRHWGRVRTALFIALALAPNKQDVWRQAVRSQILSVGSVDSPSRSGLWQLLNEGEAEILKVLHARLPVRLQTLSALESIRDQLRPLSLSYRNLLRKRPLGLIKSAMAFADNAFFEVHHRGEPDDLVLQEAGISISIESKEELSECISSLVAEAAQHAPMHPLEIGMPGAQYLESEELRDLIATCALRSKFRYLVKHVDVLDYEVDKVVHASTTTYVLRAPSAEHEQWLRFGYIERQLLDLVAPISISTDAPLPSLRSVLRQFIGRYISTGRLLFELRLQPLPRYRIHFPWEAIYTKILNFSFYEDAIEAYMDGYELQIAPQTLAVMHIKKLTISAFIRLYRALRYWALLHSEILAAIPDANREAFQNSLLPMLERKELCHILSFTNIPEPDINVFIDMMAVDLESKAHIDLQYTPLVRNSSDFFLILPRLVESAGALRNTMMNMRARAKGAGQQFALDVATLLREIFGDEAVTAERDLKSILGATDVDVATIANGCLYIWECKHSLPPTTPHEARDIWDDIEDGVKQVSLARKILLADENLNHRISQWFPRLTREQTRVTKIVPVVMMSTKMWSGLCVDGIPVRDVHSLRRTLDRDHWGVACLESETPFEFAGFALPGEGPVATAEVDDYLNPHGKYWTLRRAMCAPISAVHAKVGRSIIAYDTIVTCPFTQDWLAPLALEAGYQFVGNYTKGPKLAVLPDEFPDENDDPS